EPGPVGPTGPTGQPGDSICDCCVEPMRELLLELVGEENITISTTQQSAGGALVNADIEAVVGDFVILNDGDDAVPICKIVGLSGDALAEVSLPVNPEGDAGFCDCCEEATRDILNAIFISEGEADFLTEGSLNFVNTQNATILDLETGLVKIETANDVVVLSTCFISSIQNINPNLIIPTED
ncbi:hypothetical protein, partial [Robertmurraya korlensis]|uniref:hypothetical protein n=1 Tax=Robertmurraya korlensis TaxID=519977 RepID=UPI000824058C